MKTKFKISLLLFTLFISISCEEYLEETPPTFVSASNFWQTASDARTGVDGAYQSANTAYRRWMGHIDMFTDDVVCRPSPQVAQQLDFAQHTLDAENFVVSDISFGGIYPSLWQGIARANTVLKFVPDINMDETEKNMILGEARALRAFYYYRLIKIWGDAPMITEGIEVKADFSKPRTDVNIIYDEVIIPDLKFAEEYCSDGLHIDGHFTKWTAKMILADVYLNRAGWYRTSKTGEIVQGDQANWALARDKAKEIIDDSPHSLNTAPLVEGEEITPAYGVAWKNPYTAESILELSYIQVENFGTWYSRNINMARNGNPYWGGNNDTPLLNTPDSIALTVNNASMRFVPFTGRLITIGSNLVTPDLWDAFEDGDERRDYGLMTRYDDYNSTLAPRTILCNPTFRKLADMDYFLGEVDTNFRYTTQNIILYRYAEALLVYAEAQNEADGGPNAEAYTAINALRNRAGLADLTPGLSQDDFRKAVWNERRVELHAEFKRKFDLMRTNRLKQETTDINLEWSVAQGIYISPTQDSTRVYTFAANTYINNRPEYPDREWLWPIPLQELRLNAENDWYQNEGY